MDVARLVKYNFSKLKLKFIILKGLKRFFSYDNENICFQILAAFAVSFGPFAVGLSKGYTSPALASMQQTNPELNQTSLTNLDISDQQGSWIASLSLLGALFGGLISGVVIKHGRKKTFTIMSVPFAASWLLTMFASCVEMIYVTAFLVGCFSAIVQLATQVR